MRTLAFWSVVLVLAGLSAPAQAESIYRFRDPKTKRDVFVNRLDQVPAQQREETQLVVSDGVLVDSSNQPDKEAPQGTVIFGGRQPASVWQTIGQAFHQATHGGLAGLGLERLLTMAIDTALVREGKRPLSSAEVAQVARQALVTAWVLGTAGVLALLAWIAVMVHAFRADHRWWAVFIMLLPLLGIAYVLIHMGGERRWFKLATLLGQCAPYTVVMAAAWRCYALLSTILASRGLG